ncbi:MAG: septal ring lytic transglycosylase RlpA family protein [Pseudomonadota bacterium]
MMRVGLLILVGWLGGCAFSPAGDGPPVRDQRIPNANVTPRPEPRSASGNPPFYEVYGIRYYVMEDAADYRERGVASWYGKKFHGRPTSSGEPFDMHAVSAAHKTLPLPTWVRVTHLGNGRSIVLRVNDRGPFVDNRLIDLSYAAARELDLIEAGTGLVEVEAIRFDTPSASTAVERTPVALLYMQVGAFGELANATRLRDRIDKTVAQNVFVASDTSRQPAIHRVRVGPIASVADFDRISGQLRALGVDEVRLVNED